MYINYSYNNIIALLKDGEENYNFEAWRELQFRDIEEPVKVKDCFILLGSLYIIIKDAVYKSEDFEKLEHFSDLPFSTSSIDSPYKNYVIGDTVFINYGQDTSNNQLFQYSEDFTGWNLLTLPFMQLDEDMDFSSLDFNIQYNEKLWLISGSHYEDDKYQHVDVIYYGSDLKNLKSLNLQQYFKEQQVIKIVRYKNDYYAILEDKNENGKYSLARTSDFEHWQNMPLDIDGDKKIANAFEAGSGFYILGYVEYRKREVYLYNAETGKISAPYKFGMRGELEEINSIRNIHVDGLPIYWNPLWFCARDHNDYDRIKISTDFGEWLELMFPFFLDEVDRVMMDDQHIIVKDWASHIFIANICKRLDGEKFNPIEFLNRIKELDDSLFNVTIKKLLENSNMSYILSLDRLPDKIKEHALIANIATASELKRIIKAEVNPLLPQEKIEQIYIGMYEKLVEGK